MNTSKPSPKRARRPTAWLAAGWWLIATLAAVLLATSYYQLYRVRQEFAPLRAAAKTDTEFAVLATRHVNELHRHFARGPDAKLENADSFYYRFPLVLLKRGGGCSQRSTLLIAALDAFEIPSRKLLIGLTDSYAGHVVVEAELDGKWRVLDPLFGYVYPLDDGQLATADDLRQNDELVTRVVNADRDPFPLKYRAQVYHYHAFTRFNWFKSSALRSLRARIGAGADRWTPPGVWNRPLRLGAYTLMLVLLPLGYIYTRRRGVALSFWLRGARDT